MPMTVLQIRIEDDLKKQVSDLFESLGMDIPTAVRIFFKRALVENGIPFEVKGTPLTYKGHDLLYYLNEAQKQAHEHGVDNLSEEEIEAEIKAARAERRKKK